LFDEPDAPDDAELKLIADLDRLTGRGCARCSDVLCGHAVLFSVALGFKDAPLCPACLAGGLGRPLPELGDELTAHVRRRECFRRAWHVASDREGRPRGWRPACLARHTEAMPPAPAADPTVGEAAAFWDAGPLACGELVLQLRRRLNALRPGGVIQVRALDPAAPEDLPAWCRLTGHRLLSAAHPDYSIQRKDG
jgi:tRNA 2-thiouridine synthesizing protein A